MSQSITVAVDAMGGDNAPAVEVDGAVKAARAWSIPIVLVGHQDRLKQELEGHSVEGLDIRIHHASDVIGMKDSPSDAIRKKPDSSIRQAFQLVKDGKADAVVSAGNSGATMAIGMFLLKRIEGIERPAIATVVPNRIHQTLILDVGGNVDCKPLHLLQFALMGKVYAETIMAKKNPRIGLLSNGEEESKGNEQTRLAHRLLQDAMECYSGYVEGRDIYNGRSDVVVCDGFVGNVVLKVSEGLAETIGGMLRTEIENDLWAKIGYFLSRRAFRRFRQRIDYAEVGGAPLLGIKGTGMICHGGSNSKAIMNAIRLARESVARQVNEQLVSQLQANDQIASAPVEANSQVQGS